MIITLENKEAKLALDTHHGEIASFISKDTGIEYMWNGDPAFWSGRNPTLFPHVSSPVNKILNFKGKDYQVNNHGFCRKSEFTCQEADEDRAVFVLRDSAETLKEYPYHFELQMTYLLQGKEVQISYEIFNHEEDELYFGFGQHPAFNCPLTEDRKFSDYRIEFEKEDVAGKVLPLSYELFEKYPTYIVNKPQSRVFTLTDGLHGVRMHIDDNYHIFAVWTPMAPFVCLEPWVNTLEENDTVTPFEKRQGNICLKKGESFKISYGFELF